MNQFSTPTNSPAGSGFSGGSGDSGVSGVSGGCGSSGVSGGGGSGGGGSGFEADESVIWQGGPSHLVGLGWHVISLTVVAGVVAAKVMIPALEWRWVLIAIAVGLIPAGVQVLRIMSTRYVLTSERLISSSGVLMLKTEELELYRVRDTTVLQPLWLRLAGRGHVLLTTTDATTPHLLLLAVTDPQLVQELTRRYVELIRQRKGVRSLDLE